MIVPIYKMYESNRFELEFLPGNFFVRNEALVIIDFLNALNSTWTGSSVRTKENNVKKH